MKKKSGGRGEGPEMRRWRVTMAWLRQRWIWLVGAAVALATLVINLEALVAGAENLVGRLSPRLVLQSVDTFAVEVGQEVFQIGLIAKVANLGDTPEVLEQVTFDGGSLDIAGRGSTTIREIHQPVAFAEVVESHVLRAGDASYVKLLLPTRIHMTGQLPLPEFLVWGRWLLRVKGGLLRSSLATVTPEYVGCLEAPIPQAEWEVLAGAAIEDAHATRRRRLTPRFDKSAPVGSFLLFNADRSATLDLYGFDLTNPAAGPAGIMVWVRGPGTPPIPPGWTVLGRTYPQVWADKNLLSVYNSVHPPDASRRPRPFAAYAGSEAEMGVTESVPVTRGRDIVNVRLLSRTEYESGAPVFFRFGSGGVQTIRE